MSDRATARTGPWRHRLVRELTWVTVIKLLLLFVLWFAFFRQPDVAPPDADAVSAALLGSATPASRSPPAAVPDSKTGESPW